MEYAYRADAWQALYTAVAGATAALTGLLFIGLSLNLHTIIKVPALMARAREALGGMLSLLILAVIVLIPGQDRRVLGGELLLGSLLLVALAARLRFQTLKRTAAGRRVRWVLRYVVLDLGLVTAIIAGISLIAGQFGGLYWLVPTILIYILWSVNNIWLLVVQAVGEEQ